MADTVNIEFKDTVPPKIDSKFIEICYFIVFIDNFMSTIRISCTLNVTCLLYNDQCDTVTMTI